MVKLPLAGLRVLVVEDDDLVAALIEEWLIDQQCEIVGLYYQLDRAIEAARTAVVDIALLDVTLGSERIDPVAELLHERGTPFLLLSGFGDAAAPEHPEWRVCSKPFQTEQLMKMMLEELAAT